MTAQSGCVCSLAAPRWLDSRVSSLIRRWPRCRDSRRTAGTLRSTPLPSKSSGRSRRTVAATWRTCAQSTASCLPRSSPPSMMFSGTLKLIIASSGLGCRRFVHLTVPRVVLCGRVQGRSLMAQKKRGRIGSWLRQLPKPNPQNRWCLTTSTWSKEKPLAAVREAWQHRGRQSPTTMTSPAAIAQRSASSPVRWSSQPSR
mmetsp:Transcript_88119/g.228589  ORF Transcript_88119/g.228589 Transcript_88119/m.228589 type:complete len:200 (-) Transcript_88119:499-1098(-)